MARRNTLSKIMDWSLGLVAFGSLAFAGRAEAAMTEVTVDENSVAYTGEASAYVDIDDVDSDGSGVVHSE